MVVNLIIPFYYTDNELIEILKINNIDLDTGIKECNKFMALTGWCLNKNRKVEIKECLVNNYGIKKITDFKGVEININKRNLIIASIMENEKDALLVCIIEAIRKENY